MLGGDDGNDEDGDCRCNSGASAGGRWSGDGSAITSIGAGGIDSGGSREGEGEATSDRAGTGAEDTAKWSRGTGAIVFFAGRQNGFLTLTGSHMRASRLTMIPLARTTRSEVLARLSGPRLTPSSLLGAASPRAMVVAVDWTITTVPKGRNLSRGMVE